MKLKYVLLGLAFIVPPYGSMICGFTHYARYCKCGQIEIFPNDQNACCPSDENCNYRSGQAICPNGVIQSFGSYCESLDECIVTSFDKSSIPCKMSDSEDYLCSNETEIHKVCRGTTVTTCKNIK